MERLWLSGCGFNGSYGRIFLWLASSDWCLARACSADLSCDFGGSCSERPKQRLCLCLREQDVVDSHNAEKMSALHVAAQEGHLAAAEWLLQQKADPSAQDELDVRGYSKGGC